MTATICDRIADLGVDVRWEAQVDFGGRRYFYPTRPVLGPFAGMLVMGWVGVDTHGWRGQIWSAAGPPDGQIPPTGAPPEAQIAPTGLRSAGRGWDSEGEAISAMAGLLHGDTDGLCWRPDDDPSASRRLRRRLRLAARRRSDWKRDWRPMDQIASWLAEAVAAT